MKTKGKIASGKKPPITELALRALDQEFVADTFHQLNPRERAKWGRMRRKRGRPQRGKGAKVISVSVERELLRRADQLAKRSGLSRARLIELGLRRLLETAHSRSTKRARERQANRVGEGRSPAPSACRLGYPLERDAVQAGIPPLDLHLHPERFLKGQDLAGLPHYRDFEPILL